MSKNVLPVVYPTITTFPPYADTLAILQSHEESLSWVYSHYIQTYVIDVIDGSEKNLKSFMPCFFGDFDNRRIVNTVSDCIFLNREINPFLNIFEIPISIINSTGIDYVDLIKTSLDMSMYVYAYCDVSKIEEYKLSDSTAHEVFIFGYDDASNEFEYADFPNSKQNKYTFSTCSYSEIKRALDGVKDLFIPIVKSIALIQFVPEGPFVLDYKYIQESISDYLYPDAEKLFRLGRYIDTFVNTGEFSWVTKPYMGTGTYEYFADIPKRITSNGIDLRLYHAMCEHKRMMIERIFYLVNGGYIDNKWQSEINEYRELSHRMIRVRNKIIKFNLTGKEHILDSVPEEISRIQRDEELLLKVIFTL